MQDESKNLKTLDLRSLKNDFRPGITEAVGAYMAEAGAVCLDNQNHTSGVLFVVTGVIEKNYQICFKKVKIQAKLAHNDLEVATENGAYGISILLIEDNTDFTVIERSRKGTGVDYWFGRKDQNQPYFQKKARLEVSGILCGNSSNVSTRVKVKKRQTTKSDSTNIPAYIVVVEFGSPKAKVEKR